MAFLFEWREAVASPKGPSSSTTRHVLLTLSLHMDMTGGNCFPSTALLAERTGLSERSVCTHVDRAESEGWIRRAKHRGAGRAWAGTLYTAILPEVLKDVQRPTEEGTERGSVPTRENGRGTEGGSVRQARGTEPHDNEALKEVQSNSSVELNNNVRAVFDHWQEVSGHSRTKLTAGRRQKIRARLKTYSVDELQKALSAGCADPFYRGENDRGKRYDWVETLLKSDEAVERHLDGAGKTNGNGAHTMSAAELREWEEGLT